MRAKNGAMPVETWWPLVLDEVRKMSRVTHVHLREGKVEDVLLSHGQIRTVVVAFGSPYHASEMDGRAVHRERFHRATELVFGFPANLRVRGT